jgi:tRNA-uridine 2-sulfurtransferase
MPIARALDTNKDQTYFIWQIKATQLNHILFPVGEFENKNLVREYATSKGLITSLKPDSQGLCFVGQTSLRQMLLSVLGTKKGGIFAILTDDQIKKIGYPITKKNTIYKKNGLTKVRVGEHDGAFLYTIGQRQNLGISNGPWFVYDTDVLTNEVIVCHHDFQNNNPFVSIVIKSINWQIDPSSLPNSVYTKSENGFKLKLDSQVRYRSNVYQSTLIFDEINNEFTLEFDQPINSIASGQSVVFYLDQILLGGGIMNSMR